MDYIYILDECLDETKEEDEVILEDIESNSVLLPL